jgi:hypothetical protein
MTRAAVTWSRPAWLRVSVQRQTATVRPSASATLAATWWPLSQPSQAMKSTATSSRGTLRPELRTPRRSILRWIAVSMPSGSLMGLRG